MYDLTKSKEAFAEAVNLLPGGVNSPARAFGAVGGNPIFIERGQGAYLFDVDGNRYIDFVGSWGPMILGHGHPAVTEALEKVIRTGVSFGAPTLLESELARLVIDAVESVEMVRFVNSGTEATMSAIRLARGYTGRDKIVKFSGTYHGDRADDQYRDSHALRIWPSSLQGRTVRPRLRLVGKTESRGQSYHTDVAAMRPARRECW